MKVSEFRKKIKADITINIEGKDYQIKEVVKFRFDDDSFYIKCFLSNEFVLADDSDQEIFILVKEVKTSFQQPFPKKLEYKDKQFKFLYSAHAIAEKTWGKEIFKKGNSERFWDYESEDRYYLSLGNVDQTNQRLDFYGKIIPSEDIKF